MYVRVPPSAPFLKLLCGLCFAVLVTVFTVGPLRAQRPQICGPGAQMTLKCVDACIICDIDGFTGSNDNGGTQDEGDLPDGFCTSVNHNIQWIGFVAGSRELTLDIAVTNCKKAGGFSFGLEAGVYEVLDCDYKRSVAKSNCESNINNNTTGTFTMDALVPGNYYYLVIDGNFADVCNYAVKVTRGTTEIPQVRNSGGLRGPDRVCSGPQTYEYKINAVPGATYYDWTLDGEPYGSEKDLKQTLSFAKDGEYELCVSASNICNGAPPECVKIKVGDFAPRRVSRAGCTGSPVVVEGKIITASGSYPFTFKNKVGCDSTVVYDVVIGDATKVTIDTAVCSGKATVINGTTVTKSGDYSFAFKTKAGCDSLVTYRVTVTDVKRGSEKLGLCAGQSRTINGQVIAKAGTYDFNLKTKGGCDSVVTYTVSVSDVLRESVKLQLCAGQSRTVNGKVISAAGSYDFPLKTKGGCDSIVTYVVSVSDVLRNSVKLGLCAGQSRTVNGKVISAAGSYDFPLKTKGGCDSVVTYVVSVSDVLRDSVKLGLCAGQSRTVNGQVIAKAGTYAFTLKTKGGCDSIVTYTVSVSDVLRESVMLQLCAGQSRTVNGQDIAKSGTYDFTLKTKGGCDSVVTYVVSFSDVLRESVDLQLCAGQSRTINGQVISAAGSYDFPSKTEGGCDSIATYTVVVTDTLRGSVDTVLCPGVSATIKGRSISAAGNYQFPAKTAGGCDSLVIYRVTVRAPVVTQRDTTVCVDAVVSFDGRELREEGTYRAVRTSATGCDSVIELTLKHKSCGFSATAEASPVSCADGADGVLKAYVLGPTAPYNMTYARDGGAASAPVAMSPDSTPTVVRELPAGLYQVTFTDRFGAGVTVDVRIGTPTAVRAGTRRIADGAYDIRCAGAADGQVRGLASGGTPPYRFSWSDGRDGAQREGLGAQTLQVIVADANGCRDTARVTLTAPPRLAVEVQAIDQGCDPVLEPGGVRIMGLAGGRAGYRIRIDGVDVGPLADRYPLDPGRHVVTLSDAVDCRVDTGFTIDALRVPEVASDSIWRIVKGDSATLGVRTVGEIVGYAWDGPTGLSCATCPTPSVAPLDDATYTVTVTNADGCQARTEALVLVLIDRNMFAPTAISPNGDEINDGFTVYVADEGSLIEELRVFDRWGEEMFFATDITPGDTYAGWSGTYRGQDVNAGVYVYWARVRNSDGATELVKGEFTVMR